MPVILRTPPPDAARDPAALTRWFAGLTPAERGVFEAHVESLIAALPPKRKALFNALREQGSVIEPARNMRHLGALGLFDVTGLVGVLAQVGVSAWAGKEQQGLQKDLAKDASATQIKIAQIQDASAQASNKLMAEVQTEAAKIAAAVDLEKARLKAQQTSAIMTSAMPVVLGGLALTAVVVLIAMKKRRSSAGAA